MRHSAQAGDDACDRRLRFGRLDEHLEGKPEVALADRDPFVAGLAERPPRSLGKRFAAQAGERLGRAEPRGRSTHEQDAAQAAVGRTQPATRHGSV